MNERIAEVMREQAREGELSCAGAFRIAKELSVTPQAVGQTADAIGVRFIRCQLGLFGYGEQKSIVSPADKVSPELEQAVQEGLILGRLPCPVAWAIAARFRIPKRDVADGVEKMGIRIAQCQIGAF